MNTTTRRLEPHSHVRLRPKYVPQTSIINRLQTNFYDALCFVLKVRIYVPMRVFNEYYVSRILKFSEEIGVLGGKLCATNRLSGMCCFSGFPVAQ